MQLPNLIDSTALTTTKHTRSAGADSEVTRTAALTTNSSSSSSSSSSTQPPCPGSERLTQVGPFPLNDEPVGYRIDGALMRRCLESCFAQVKSPFIYGSSRRGGFDDCCLSSSDPISTPIQTKVADVVAACSDWWVKHADARGAGSTNCIILGRIAARALDSAKTARLWSLPPMLKVRRARAFHVQDLNQASSHS